MSQNEESESYFFLVIWYLVGVCIILGPSGFDLDAVTRSGDILYIAGLLAIAAPIGFFAFILTEIIKLILSLFVDGIREKDFSLIAFALFLILGLM